MAERLMLPDLGEYDEMFLHELSERIGELASAHVESEIAYYPYDYVDEMDQAITDGLIDFDDPETQMDEATRQALIVNLLTEEGLPEYTSTIQRRLPFNHPLRHWSNLWTADEGRHAPTISGMLHKTRQFSMRELEQMRMLMMKFPDTPQPDSIIESFIYPGIQEPATEISHRNTMRRFPRGLIIAKRAIGSVVRDEVKTGGFYAGASEAAMELAPSITVIGIARQVRAFAMPGKSIPGFDDRAQIIEEADIFGLKQLRKIYEDFIVKRLGVFKLDNLSETAELAREDIARRLRIMDKILERRAEQAAEVTALTAS